MSHDKIKAAARARMAQTGEPYSVARRAVIEERKQETKKIGMTSTATNEVPSKRSGEATIMPEAVAGSMQADIGNVTRFAEQLKNIPVVDPAIMDTLNRAAEQATKAREMIRRMGLV